MATAYANKPSRKTSPAPKPVIRVGATGDETSTKEYRCWVRMYHRCHNPNYEGFHNYGGRGITICRAWADYDTFLEDMGRAPSEEHSIDRYPDNDGNYEPDNCRWATREMQANNRRTSVNLTLGKETMTMQEWATKLGCSRKKLWKRKKMGWDDGRTLTEGFQHNPA